MNDVGVGGAAEVGVEGNNEVEFREEAGEGGEDKGEGKIGICEPEKADGVRDGFAEEG